MATNLPYEALLPLDDGVLATYIDVLNTQAEEVTKRGR